MERYRNERAARRRKQRQARLRRLTAVLAVAACAVVIFTGARIVNARMSEQVQPLGVVMPTLLPGVTPQPQPTQAPAAGTQLTGDNAWMLMLVNKWHALPDGYEPPSLTELSNGQSVDMIPIFRQNFIDSLNHARENVFIKISRNHRNIFGHRTGNGAFKRNIRPASALRHQKLFIDQRTNRLAYGLAADAELLRQFFFRRDAFSIAQSSLFNLFCEPCCDLSVLFLHLSPPFPDHRYVGQHLLPDSSSALHDSTIQQYNFQYNSQYF